MRWYIAYPVKIVYINAALAALYYGLQAIEVIAPDVASHFDYWAIAILGTVALLVIDLLMQYVYRTLKKVLAKVLRDKHDNPVTEEEIRREDERENDDNPFGDDM